MVSRIVGAGTLLQLPKQLINLALNDGGIGDQVCRLPAIKYCLDQYPHVSYEVWTPGYFVDFARHFFRGYEDRCQFIPMARMPLLMDQSLMSVAFKNDYVTTLRMHLVDHAFNIMDGAVPDVKYRNYLKLSIDEIDTTKFCLKPDTYICLTPGYTATVRALLPQVWNALAAYIVGKGLTPLWLGNKEAVETPGVTIKAQIDEEIDFSVGIDLRQQTSLLEAGKIMALSAATVGLDNGLLHVAGCTDTKIVAGYTSVSSEIRLPYRKNQLGWNTYVVEPEASLDCRYCQVQFNYLFHHDFRNCYTKTLECVKQLTAEKFIQQLEAALET